MTTYRQIYQDFDITPTVMLEQLVVAQGELPLKSDGFNYVVNEIPFPITEQGLRDAYKALIKSKLGLQ